VPTSLGQPLKASMARGHSLRSHACSRKFKGKVVWDGVVHTFDLEGHPKATRAYAWSSPIKGSDNRRFYAVLHLGGVRSPLDAVRAAVAVPD
jgi:hypothetical protein